MTRRHGTGGPGHRTPSAVDLDWLKVLAASARLWRPGEVVDQGEFIGRTRAGAPVFASSVARVTEIQYDVETDEVILVVERMPGYQ